MSGTGSGVVRRLLGRAGDRQRGFAEAGVAVTGAALVLGAALGSGVASTVVTMSDGVTWLPDDATGQVVQINPGTGRAERRLQVAEPGSELEISQRDGHLLIADGRTGTLHSIDLATLMAGGQRRADEPSRVLVGGGRVYLVTPSSGVVRAVDPLTLRDLGAPYRADATLADAVVDAAGAVWLVTTRGDLRSATWSPQDGAFDAGDVKRVHGAGAGTRLLPHARGVTVFAPDSGTVLQVGVGRDLAVAVPDLSGEVLPAATAPTDLAPAGVPGRSAVVMLAGNRVLDVDVGASGCARPGSPAVFAGLVYVPCAGAGRVVVLRADGSRARADVLLPAGRDPRLLVDDGRLVVHTEDGAKAVVVEADGRTRVIDTGRSQAAVHDPRDGGSAPVAAQPPPRPSVPQGTAGEPPPGAWSGAVVVGPDGPPAGSGGTADDGSGPGPGPTDAPSPGPSRSPALARPSAGAGATPEPTARPPAAPTGVEATPGPLDDEALADVVVTWQHASSPPDAYVVRTSVVGVAPLEVDGGATGATVRGVVCGMRGTFTVEAVDGSARSAAASSPAVRTPPCPAAPAAPRGVTAVAHPDGSVTVSWEVSSDPVDSYLVGPDGGSTTTAGAAATSIVLRDVPPGPAVRFGVRATHGRLTSAAVLSPAVAVAGAPGPVAPITVTLERRLDREITFVVRWTPPDDNGSSLTRYVVTWTGTGISGSSTPGAVSGCSAGQGCGSGAAQRTEVQVDAPCSGAGVCADGGPLTITVAAENGVGTGPVASAELDVPPASGRTTVIAGVEAVTPALNDPDVHMVVHLDPPPVFRDHPGACLLEVEHSAGSRSTSGWSCQPGDVVIGPFPEGVITVTARTVSPDGSAGYGSMPSRADVPPRNQWAYCDLTTGICTDPVGLAGPPVVVVPVPWTPRLPVGPERPPLAATGAGLLLAAGALRSLRLRRAERAAAAHPRPTPHATTEETPA
ncbi:hypothetical protein [Cellulomonas sp. S1-8]|uniref:hypothetical protein n=1 Tax=Cellulomonas sp. S1-8 TaxID=2904790 RepID=UPI0022446CCE|nr:hypothetical protein [Cellulomonas sp. S1-8]UZN04535.1 hypothetical protein OKX07_06370 [Cellulomonas sp. S1-8]